MFKNNKVLSIKGNTVVYNDVVAFGFKIEPINTIFANQSQSDALADNLSAIIGKVNKPGQIIIRPVPVDVEGVMDFYENSYTKYGDTELKYLKDKIVASTRKGLSKSIRYRYEVYLFFVQNRESLDKRKVSFLNNDEFSSFVENYIVRDKEFDELTQAVSDQIYNDIRLHTSELISRLDDKEEMMSLINYLSCPTNKTYDDYNVIPHADHLNYRIRYNAKSSYETDLFARHIVLNSAPEELRSATKFFNNLQLKSYPIDIVVKFEPRPTDEIEKKLARAQYDIDEDIKAHYKHSLFNKKTVEQKKAEIMAQGGSDGTVLPDDTLLCWQFQFRVRAESYEMLCKRTDNLKLALNSGKIGWTYATKKQHLLMFDMLPWSSLYKENVQTTTIGYFSKLNLLGGIKIGLDKGLWVGNTVPGNLPVFADPDAVIAGEAKANEPVTMATGATGAGKTQIINNYALLSVVILGHVMIYIQPKPEGSTKLLDLFYDKETDTKHYTNLVLGGDGQQGMFDCFVTANIIKQGQIDLEAFKKAVEDAKQICARLIRAENPEHTVNTFSIQNAAYKMLEDLQRAPSIKKDMLTMTRLLVYLAQIDIQMTRTLISMAHNNIGALFFSETGNEYSFDLSQPFNMITFAELPRSSRNEDKRASDIQHALHEIVLGRIEFLINKFNELYKHRKKTILVDEYRIFTAYQEGKDIISALERVARQMAINPLLISQKLTDYDDGTFSSTGQMFVGSLKSDEEINLCIEKLRLEDSPTIRKRLQDQTENEGVNEEDKWIFLYLDPNNRKAFIRLEFLDLFQEAFRTLLDREEVANNAKT